jgi:hypothetical protein
MYVELLDIVKTNMYCKTLLLRNPLAKKSHPIFPSRITDSVANSRELTKLKLNILKSAWMGPDKMNKSESAKLLR